MRIMALDLATSTGWASGDSAEEPRFGTFKLPSTGDDIGRFACEFNLWLRGMIAVERPELLVFEAPILKSGGSSIDFKTGKPRKFETSVATARKLMGLAFLTEMIGVDLGIRVAEGHIGKVKKFFGGHGLSDKDQMMHVARKYGWDVKTDDEADALGLWALSVHTRTKDGHRFAFGPMGAKAFAR